MIELNELNNKYGIKGELAFERLNNNLIFLKVSNKFAEANICLYGAHITSYKPRNSKDILWMSPDTPFEEGKAIRGGIPVCFPWFGPHKTDSGMPQHGFGRLMYWNMAETAVLPQGETLVRLKLSSSDQTKAYWPYDFDAEMNIVIGNELKLTLKVINTCDNQFDYSCALHTYYKLSAIEEMTIDGLEGTRFHIHLQPGDYIQETPKMEIHQAETRHYHDTEATCIINDPGFARKIRVAKSGSKITTVWNPWKEACSTIGDLPNDAYNYFVCIEAVNSFEDTISLYPGESHETSAIIRLME